jgi:hypothetical protein
LRVSPLAARRVNEGARAREAQNIEPTRTGATVAVARPEVLKSPLFKRQ